MAFARALLNNCLQLVAVVVVVALVRLVATRIRITLNLKFDRSEKREKMETQHFVGHKPSKNHLRLR